MDFFSKIFQVSNPDGKQLINFESDLDPPVDHQITTLGNPFIHSFIHSFICFFNENTVITQWFNNMQWIKRSIIGVCAQLILFWRAGKADKGGLTDSGLGAASDADSHDDSIAVEGDKLVMRCQSMPVTAAAAAAAVESSAYDAVRYYHVGLC